MQYLRYSQLNAEAVYRDRRFIARVVFLEHKRNVFTKLRNVIWLQNKVAGAAVHDLALKYCAVKGGKHHKQRLLSVFTFYAAHNADSVKPCHKRVHQHYVGLFVSYSSAKLLAVFDAKFDRQVKILKYFHVRL